MSGYAFNFQGKGFMPDGSEPIAESDVDSHNRATEQAEIEWIKTGPDKVFLYVRMPEPTYQIDFDHYANSGYYAGHIEANHFTSRADCETEIKARLADKRLARFDSRGFEIRWKACKLQTLTGTKINTWLGTSVGTHVIVGMGRTFYGFAKSTRRSISCRIFGVQYHGWYMESSGDYCRLKRAKKQLEVKA